MASYWNDLVQEAQRISIYRSPGMEYNEERCRNYVVNQAGNAIDAMIQMHGEDRFLKMIKERPCAPNPKYDLLVKNYRDDIADRMDLLRKALGGSHL